MERIQLNSKKGVGIIEALIAAVIVGIGFVAVYSLANVSTNILMSSIDREKGNMLTTAIYEDLLTDTENLISYHMMDFTNTSTGTTKHLKKKDKWAKMANKKFGNPQSNDKRQIKVVKKTIDGKDVFVVTINIKSRNGIAKNHFKRTINAPQ
tara:strand:+ start:134 stop:589 length:456 start_codon:yes stop_codon:yes gene_type:complete